MGIFKRGRHYHFEFEINGVRVQKSTRQGDRQEAKTMMAAERSRLARVRFGLESPDPKPKPTNPPSVKELLDGLEKDYQIREKGSVRNLSHIARARKDFGGMKAADLTAERVDEYIQKRITAGAAAATINRVTQLLGQAYKLAIARKQLSAAPVIRRLSEKGNARQGFFSEKEFRAVQSELPADLQDFAGFSYLTGWRKGEVASLRWEDVQDGVVRLRGEDSKNGEPRAVVLQGELAKLIERRKEARAVKGEEGSVAMAAWIFHRHGDPVREFRKSWATACVAAKVGVMVCPKCEGEGDALSCPQCEKPTAYRGRIFHDLRRTAVRNMIRAGVPERVAMSISGHKTRSIFDRYNITNEQDLAAAMKRVDRYLKTAKDNLLSLPKRAAR